MFNRDYGKSNFRLKGLELLCHMATDIFIASMNHEKGPVSEKEAVAIAGRIYTQVKRQTEIVETFD